MFEKMYFFLNQLLKRYQAKDEYSENAFFLISLWQVINIDTLLLVVKYFFQMQFEKVEMIYFAIITYVIISIINKFYLQNRKEIIYLKTKSLNRSEKKLWIAIAWIYFLGTPALFIFLLKYLK